jgi:26S proteasome non-ATPase regulatory subunit 9
MAVINTDYRILMKQIEAEVGRLHAASSAESIPALPVPSASDDHKEKPPAILIPFARLDEVQEGSPAMLAGICDNDLLISFGGVDISTPSPMSAIPQAVGKYTNKAMEVVVLRDTVTHYLSLTPSSWSGRGLIGCHLTPI